MIVLKSKTDQVVDFKGILIGPDPVRVEHPGKLLGTTDEGALIILAECREIVVVADAVYTGLDGKQDEGNQGRKEKKGAGASKRGS